MPTLRLPTLVVALAFGLSLVGLAQEPIVPPEKKPAEPAAGSVAPVPGQETKPSVVSRTVKIGGQAINYTATTGYITLKDEVEKGGGDEKGGGKGAGEGDVLKAKARIFFVAYTRTDVDRATRPVTFAFNGGPGAASVWLHLGALGPRRVDLGPTGNGTAPPYRLVDNASSWLDETDLVFIDPVSTGYSRPVPGEAARSFHGFVEDLKSVAAFIRDYLTQNNRWLSPKYLVGESYGGTRAAALAGLLQDQHDIYLNGVIIVSGLLNWQTIDFRPGNDLPYALVIPTFATTAQHHGKLAPELQAKTGDDLRAEAQAFATTEYAPALARGSALPAPEREKLTAKLAYYTGLPTEVIARHQLRVSAGVFMDELLKGENRCVGRFDSRATGIMTDPDGSDFDPSFTTMRGNVTATINDYLRTELGFVTELPYRSLANVGPWNFGNAENRYLDVSESLTKAMTKNPYLRLWVVAGEFDLAISAYATDYTLRQMPLAPELREHLRFNKYESGHMLYTDEAVLKQFKADFLSFLAGAKKP